MLRTDQSNEIVAFLNEKIIPKESASLHDCKANKSFEKRLFSVKRKKSKLETMSSDCCEAGPSNFKNGIKKISFTEKLKNLKRSSLEKNETDHQQDTCEPDTPNDFFEFYESDEETDVYPPEVEEKDEIDIEALKVHEEALREDILFYEPSVPFLPNIDSLVERRCLTIFGSLRHIEPITDSIEKTHLFSRELKVRLKNIGFITASPIQAHLWPNITKGLSICCISSPRSGKTSAYLISIFQSLSKLVNDSAELASGPDYIIVCSNYKVVQNVFNEAIKLKGSETLPRFIALDSYNYEQQSIPLLNGCEVLISTPSPLLRLMNERVDYFKNSTTLIFDDCDKALELHFPAIKEIFAKFLVQSKKRLTPKETLNRALFVQTMIFSEKWTDKIENFHSTQSRSFLLFGNYFEATIFKKISNQITIIDEDEQKRLSALTHILVDVMESLKSGEYDSIAIVCRDSIESYSVSDHLKKIRVNSRKVEPVVINEKSPHYEHQTLVARWQTGKEILIITDEVISYFPQISAISHLIHFSLPSFSKGAFAARFQLMYSLLRKEDKNNKLVSHIVCSCENQLQVLQLYKYLQRCGSDIPPLLRNIKESISVPLCHSFLTLGFCPFKKYFCKCRHSFKDEKPIHGLPIDGQIKGRITFTRSPNEFYFIIEEYRSASSYKWKKFERQMPLKIMNEKLQQLRDSDILEFVTEVIVDEMYAIVVRDTVHRVKVVKDLGHQPLKGYQMTKKEMNSRLIILFHVDFGYYTRAYSYDLILLPTELKRIPPFANKIFLFGIKPPDNEIEWNVKSTQAFFEKVMGKSANYLTAWVRLQLNGDIWVDTLTACSKFSQIGVEVVSSKPTNILIDQRLAEKNVKKLPNFNTNKSEILSKWMCERQKHVVQFAFVEESIYHLVYLCHFVSFNHFYVRFEKFDDILMKLEDEITAQDKRQLVNYFVVGLICVCKHESGVLNRIRIEEILEDTVKAFFLDHGETGIVQKQNCFHIDEKFVTRLPFQAIKCKLNGVEGEIDENIIYDYTRFEDEKFKILLLEKVSYHFDTNVVRLYLKRDQKTPFIFDRVSKWLIDNKHAKYSSDDEVKSDETKELANVEDVGEDDSSDEYSDSDDPQVRFWDQCLGLDILKKLAIDSEKNGHTKNKQKNIKKESKAQKLKKSLQKIKGKETVEENDEISNTSITTDEFDYELDKNMVPLPYDPDDDYNGNESDGEILEVDDDCFL